MKTIGDIEYALAQPDVENREYLETDLKDRWQKVSKYYEEDDLANWRLVDLLRERAIVEDDFDAAIAAQEDEQIYLFDIRRIALAFEVMRRKILPTSESEPPKSPTKA